MDITSFSSMVLVLVTLWYAWSNHRVLKQVSRQAETMEKQSKIIAKQTELLSLSALATTWAALHHGSGPHNQDLELLAEKLKSELGVSAIRVERGI